VVACGVVQSLFRLQQHVVLPKRVIAIGYVRRQPLATKWASEENEEEAGNMQCVMA
jgi:hypothetical protein